MKHIKTFEGFTSPYIPTDKDLDTSLKHEDANLLYDFWRSDYEKSWIGLTNWLEDNNYAAFKDGKWQGFDGILYQFWSQHPEAEEATLEEGGLNSLFFNWLKEAGYEIKLDR